MGKLIPKIVIAVLVIILILIVGKIFFLQTQHISELIKAGNNGRVELLFRIYGPEKITNKISSESGNSVKFDCFPIFYEAGKIAYAAIGDRAYDKYIPSCNSAYIHGAIGAYVKDTGVNNFPSKMTSLCSKFDTVFEQRECFHSSGHGLMQSTNDNVESSAAFCSSYTDKLKKTDCLVGVFMEKGGWLMQEDSNSQQEVSEICGAYQDSDLVNVCYQVNFASTALQTLNTKDARELTPLCLAAGSEVAVKNCFWGYGVHVARQYSYYPPKIVELCSSISQGTYQASCLQGAQAIILDFVGENIKGEGVEFCNAVPAFYKNSCASFLERRMKMFVE